MKNYQSLISVTFLCMLCIALTSPSLADTWKTQLIDGSDINGVDNDMAVDADGYLHIVTYDEQNDTLEYVYQNSSGWHQEIIDTFESYRAETSIAVDSTGNPHISYYSYEHRQIKYARRNQNGWSIEPVLNDVSSIKASCIVLKSNDAPYICFGRSDTQLIKCAHKEGATWSIENVGAGYSPRDFECQFGMVIDANDRIHVSYIHQLANDLIYCYSDGSGWTHETVDNGFIRGDYTALVIDGSGKPHIAYTTDSLDDNRYAVELKYAVKNGSTWTTSFIDPTDEVGTYVSMALNPTGQPAVCYHDIDNGYLKYAVYQGNSWKSSFVDTNPGVGEYCCMTVSESGITSIAYNDSQNRDLKVATKNGTGWQLERPVTTGLKGLYRWITVDSNDCPQFAYSGGGNEDLKHAYWDGSQWQFDIVSSVGRCGISPVMALDPNDNPHIVHGDSVSGDILYTWRTGTTWQSNVIGEYRDSYSYWSLDLDSNSYPHICHENPDNGYLIYTWKNASGWNSEAVLKEPIQSYNSIIAMNSNDQPCVVFKSNNELLYAQKINNTWEMKTIDSDYYLSSKVEFALDQNDLPHVVYQNTSADELMYATLNGSQWVIESVDETGATFGTATTSFALDAQGKPNILCDSLRLGQTVVYTKSNNEWTHEFCMDDGTISIGNMAIGTNNVPHVCFRDTQLYYTAKVPETTGTTIAMPASSYRTGNQFYCKVTVANDSLNPLSQYPLFVLLDVYGTIFFAPTFNTEFDCYLSAYPEFQSGNTTVTVLPEFTWPAAGSGVATWYSAMTNPEMTELYGEMDAAGFTWSE